MTQKSNDDSSQWDFRDEDEIKTCTRYEKYGYVIEEAESYYLNLLKKDIEDAFIEFVENHGGKASSLEEAHKTVSKEESNDLRLHVMQRICQTTSFHRNYYKSARGIIHKLCGNELAMQRRPGLSVNLPLNSDDILPIHADTWNGVSPFELNIWIPLVNCANSMSLYILERDKYEYRLKNSEGLLQLTSDELFEELKADLTWIPIAYGQILAFDQSLPHGYTINLERCSHWSINCRFKGLHTPYWDKKLGEYFMPITVKDCTRLGMKYKHPENWI